MAKNLCYTYFRIAGNFNPREVTEMLGLQPSRSWDKGDTGKNGHIYDFAAWEFGRCDEYDDITANQMHKTIEPLLDKVHILNNIRATYDVVFYLEIVPSLYAKNVTPSLSPSMQVIDFCHATRTEIDIDMYLMEL